MNDKEGVWSAGAGPVNSQLDGTSVDHPVGAPRRRVVTVYKGRQYPLKIRERH